MAESWFLIILIWFKAFNKFRSQIIGELIGEALLMIEIS